MKLEVLSLAGVQYSGDAKSINAKTSSGEITVLDHHLPLITVLAKGRLIIKPARTTDVVQSGGDAQEIIIPVNSGFFEVSQGNKASALID